MIKKDSIFLAIFLLSFLSTIEVYSNPGSKLKIQEGNNLKFVKYPVSLGLSSNAQRCIVQDNEGFIWIGTDDGLNRFDGYNFKVYRRNPEDSSSLRSNIINCLFIDSKGILWVGTISGGLSRYDKEKDNFYNFTMNINDSTALLNNDITTIAEDKFHHLWVGTVEGLHLFDPKTNGFLRFTQAGSPIDLTSIAHNHIVTILVDNEISWIAYKTGILSALNTSDMTFKHYKLFDIPSWFTADFLVTSLVSDDNKIWISTWSQGIWIFDKATGKCNPYEKENNRYINFIYKDSRGKIWYSPEHKGLVLLNGSEKNIYQFDDYDNYSLSSNSLAAMFQDKQENLWLASRQGDLNYAILDNPFTTWFKNPNSAHGLTNNLVTAVIEDSKGRIWVGYQDGGIDILDSKNRLPKIHIKGDNTAGLGPGTIIYIYESKNGTIWVGKYLDGLKKFNEKTKTFTSYHHIESDKKSIAGNDIRYLTEDSKGNLWIAIHGAGVDKFNPVTESFVHYKHDENNPSTTIISDWTYTVVCDKDDNIWIGTTMGVSVISEKTFNIKHYLYNYDEGYNLSNRISRVIFIDSKNYVWVGTIDGLNKINPEDNTIQKYFAKDGLSNSIIMDILEDDNYNLWISTAKGLSKFSPDQKTFKNYSVQDGLVTDEFNVFASFKSTSGEMYFGGREGVNRFNPDEIKINNFKPPVYITDFKLFNQSVYVKKDNSSEGFSLPKQINFCDEITLDYHQNVITIEFVALNFHNLEKNQYKYKLEGFEEEWNLPGYIRFVTYTNLHPGEYTFRVIASNDDGIWNAEGASLKIIVNPPFWRTGWAYAFYLLIILLLLYAFRKLILHEAEIKNKLEVEELEIKKLQEMDTLKMRFFSNVSHEFRTPLTLIAGPLEKLIKDIKDESQKIQLNLIKRNASRLMRLINQLMDFRKIEEAKLEMNFEKNDLVHFIKDIFDSFNHEAKERRINYSLIQACSSLEVWFDHDKLDKITYNLLSNAFKFTQDGGSISLSIIVDEASANYSGVDAKRTIEIIVKDSGIGIPKESQSKIFDRFYQVKNYLNTPGTGIGLSLTYELVRLHNGNIFLESEPNTGATFTVILPLWTEESELPSSSSTYKRVDKGDGLKISKESTPELITQTVNENKNEKNLPHLLIIEDNPDMRLYIKDEFKNIYTITEAHNGATGIEKALEEIPDAIICDVMMPGIDGYEVCRKLKLDEKTSHIPILMLTAKSSEQHTIEGFESGADDYVAKPFSSAILKVRIKSLIDSRELLRKKFIKDPFAAIKDFSPSKTDEALLKKAYAIVEKNLSNPDFEVSDFAYEIGMSRTQLYRKINALAGQTVKEFIRIIRLKKAAELLVTSEMNITEVAYEIGFGSQTYFSTSFTEYFGVSPSKYVEKHIRS